MITEKDISKTIGRTIKSPIRMGSLEDLGVKNATEFLELYRPFFEELDDDLYLVREKQFQFISELNPQAKEQLEKLHHKFYSGEVDLAAFSEWTSVFSEQELEEFEQLSLVTRQRNISSFRVEEKDGKTEISRIFPKEFSQKVEDSRTWSRVFTQATEECVENPLFSKLLTAVWNMVKSLHPEVSSVQITSHFMRTLSYEKVLGENSPEGVHEDGAPYIISALVINRQHADGGISQVYEQLENGKKELVFERTLASGEFLFQGDTGEELIYGNDLWHYVTGISPAAGAEVGIRDIIGFDIELGV